MPTALLRSLTLNGKAWQPESLSDPIFALAVRPLLEMLEEKGGGELMLRVIPRSVQCGNCLCALSAEEVAAGEDCCERCLAGSCWMCRESQ